MPDSTDLPVNLPTDDGAHAAAAPATASSAATPTPPDALAVPAPDQVANAAAATAESDADTDTDASTDAAADAPAPAAAAAGAATPPLLSPAAAAELLRQHFPALFAGPAKPFKLRIQQDIQQRAPGVFSKASLSAYFRRHTGSTSYLIALSKATHRFDLDGQPAGALSDEHRQLAQVELTRRRQLAREREQQAQTQQREAQRAEMAQQAEAMQARQARATLLRDFQRTTLTLANFCALKGMAPDALTPLLEQAKKEAAEAPTLALHALDERRGPGPRRDERAPGRPDARGPRRDDRRPARPGGPTAGTPGGAPGGRGPRGPAGQS